MGPFERYYPPELAVGQIVQYDGSWWRVGLVNESRARLDPLTGEQTILPNGRQFVSYGSGVNVGPTSHLPTLTETELAELGELNGNRADVQRRIARLRGGDDTMEAETTEIEAGVSGAPIPTSAGRKKATNGAAGKARAAKPAPVAKAVKVAKPKEPKVERACACGCGGTTTGYFVPGHDARFKGWMLKIERGLVETQTATGMPKKIVNAYEWKQRGKNADTGFMKYVATTNYKGEKHAGYDNSVKG